MSSRGYTLHSVRSQLSFLYSSITYFHYSPHFLVYWWRVFQDELIKPVLESCNILLYLNLACTNITDASLRTLAK